MKMRSTYSLLNGTELLELLTESILISVPRKAAKGTVLAIMKLIHWKDVKVNLPDEELGHLD